jgi:hypothetical protein
MTFPRHIRACQIVLATMTMAACTGEPPPKKRFKQDRPTGGTDPTAVAEGIIKTEAEPAEDTEVPEEAELPPPVTIDESSVVTVGLDAEQATLGFPIADIEWCYERHRGDNERSGTLSLELEVDGDGEVTTVKVRRDTLRNKPLDACTIERLERKRFGKPTQSPASIKLTLELVPPPPPPKEG